MRITQEDLVNAFSPDYAAARGRFREAASRLGWQLESHPIDVAGPNEGEELTVDIGCSTESDPGKVLVVSSGVHGVEGFFGSAVQLALRKRWVIESPPSVKCVFLHGQKPIWLCVASAG